MAMWKSVDVVISLVPLWSHYVRQHVRLETCTHSPPTLLRTTDTPHHIPVSRISSQLNASNLSDCSFVLMRIITALRKHLRSPVLDINNVAVIIRNQFYGRYGRYPILILILDHLVNQRLDVHSNNI